jgi:hypothetical protein
MRAVMNVVMYILSTGWQSVPFVLGLCASVSAQKAGTSTDTG